MFWASLPSPTSLVLTNQHHKGDKACARRHHYRIPDPPTSKCNNALHSASRSPFPDVAVTLYGHPRMRSATRKGPTDVIKYLKPELKTRGVKKKKKITESALSFHAATCIRKCNHFRCVRNYNERTAATGHLATVGEQSNSRHYPAT